MTTSKTKYAAPVIIACLIGGFILFLVWAALQAKTLGPRITDPDYYSKGLRYNTTLVEQRAASVLGWKISSSLMDGQLHIQLLDKQRQPVSRANGLLFLYLAGDDETKPIPLQETEPGLYSADLPMTKPGEFRARVEFDSAGARLSRDLLLNL